VFLAVETANARTLNCDLAAVEADLALRSAPAMRPAALVAGVTRATNRLGVDDVLVSGQPLTGLDWPLAVPRSSGVMWAKGRIAFPSTVGISWRRSISWRVLRSASSSPWGGAITAYSPEHCASDILALRLARCGQGQIEAHL
jgi:hypothetical protein